MKVLIVSVNGELSDAGRRLQEEGHAVKLYIDSKTERDFLQGFVPHSSSWQGEVSWADLVIFDGTKWGDAPRLTRAVKPTIGGTQRTSSWEDDREAGLDLFKAMHFPIPEYHQVKNAREAIRYIESYPMKYVLKPDGNADDKSLTYVGQLEDGEDVIGKLERAEERGEQVPFILQEKIDGVEVGTGAMFNGKEFLPPFEVTFEHKRFFTYALGPNTGEQGTAMFFRSDHALAQELQKMTPYLRKEGYVGQASINFIVNSDGIWPLEFTMRFGYPAQDLYEELLEMPLGTYLWQIAKGQSFEAPMSANVGIVTVVAIPPYPELDITSKASPNGVRVHGFPSKFDSRLHLYGVKKVENSYQVSGIEGYVLTSTGQGDTVEEARAQSLAPLWPQGPVYIPDMFYRVDIGDHFREDMDELKNLGYTFEDQEDQEDQEDKEDAHEELEALSEAG